jgi:hypothetical protein
MSLQAAAQHLSSHGRGNDSTLVHMSPREVSSLNAIAKAHGGQLSTNPHTGLPEAGFLESILPMAAGFALNAAVPGIGAAMGGFAVPALVGGGMALMTGSLEKGLMAGLGAYGGANLGASLAQQGVEQAAAQQLAQDQAFQAAQTQAAGNAASLAQAPVNLANEAFMGPHMPALTPAQYATQAQNITEPLRQAQAAALENQGDIYKDLGFGEKMKRDFGTLTSPGGASGLFDKVTSSPMSLLKTVGSSAAPAVSEAMKQKPPEEEKPNTDMGQRYGFSPGYANPMPGANPMGQEQTFMNPTYRPIGNDEAKKIYGYADGGATADPAAPPAPTSYTAAQPSTPITTPAPAFEVPEVNSLADLIRAKESQRFIDAYLNRPAPIDVQGQYNDYLQRTLNAPPTAVANSGVRTTAPSASTNADDEYIFDANTQRYVPNPKLAETKAKTKKKSFFDGSGATNNVNFRGTNSGGGGLSMPQPFGRAAGGSISDAGYNLGGYSDGGRLLRGPGDGVSDSIPAVIGKKQPARLADGEFVVPARIVSELGNGSTEAGARKLYAMMDRIQKARGKTVGKGKVAKNSRSDKYLPA